MSLVGFAVEGCGRRVGAGMAHQFGRDVGSVHGFHVGRKLLSHGVQRKCLFCVPEFSAGSSQDVSAFVVVLLEFGEFAFFRHGPWHEFVEQVEMFFDDADVRCIVDWDDP
jgi:hypothetical protein